MGLASRSLLLAAACLPLVSACADASLSGDLAHAPSGERYRDYGENPFIDAAQENVSTFGADVDTASYTLMRRDLLGGTLPNKVGVRVEEYVNYFGYDYPAPGAEPLSVSLEGAPSKFGEGLSLLRIGVKAREISAEQRQPVNLVFLVDVSGSMYAPNKLGLVKYALGHLVKKLAPADTLGIVLYAGSERVLLQPTPVSNKAAILDAIESLTAGGSTAGEAGIRAAYDLAEKAKRQDGVNRVVLCTDGDFNVGVTGDDLVNLVKSFRNRGIFLTTLGFGQGNYNDETMEQLADHGNGNYAYIDTPNEALRVLGDKLVGTLQVVAKDVKFQVEFDKTAVKRYRLIGYENRVLENEDFENDAVDSGDVGAGHQVTALYEVELMESRSEHIAEVRVRYKEPAGDESKLLTFPFARPALRADFDSASASLRFAAAVAEFAEILRGSSQSAGARFDDVRAVAAGAMPAAATADRTEFLDLVHRAKALWK